MSFQYEGANPKNHTKINNEQVVIEIRVFFPFRGGEGGCHGGGRSKKYNTNAMSFQYEGANPKTTHKSITNKLLLKSVFCFPFRGGEGGGHGGGRLKKYNTNAMSFQYEGGPC